jgi:hypothetical protein
MRMMNFFIPNMGTSVGGSGSTIHPNRVWNQLMPTHRLKKRIWRTRMVRHKVYVKATTYDTHGNIQRDSIGVGGRRTVGSAKVIFNVDTAEGQNQEIEVKVTVDENGKGIVELWCPTEFKLHINKPKVK